MRMHGSAEVKRYLQHVVSSDSRQMDGSVLDKVSSSLRAELMSPAAGSEFCAGTCLVAPFRTGVC